MFICIHCVTSSNHEDHKIEDAKRKFEINKDHLQNDLQEFNNLIYSKYLEIAKDIRVRTSKLHTYFNELESTLSQQREKWYREIDNAISEMQIDLLRIKNNLSLPLSKQELDININISEINQSILDIKHLLQSNEVYKVSAYKSNIAKFRKVPPKFEIGLPKFSLQY